MKSNQRSPFRKVALGMLGVGLTTVAACGHNDMDMMSNHSVVFDEHASGYQAELVNHGVAVEAATDLSQIAVFETDHVSRTLPHMSAMRHELGDMMGCMGPAGEQPDSQDVLGDLDVLQQECDGHEAAMIAAVDVVSARAEESRHQAQMTAMMREMETHADTMMDGTDHFGCAHHSR